MGMTEQEALKYMKLFRDEWDRNSKTKNAMALDVSIKAIEKQIAKKPIRKDECTCPSCGTHNEIIKKRRNTIAHDTVYCWHCGQAMEVNRLGE